MINGIKSMFNSPSAVLRLCCLLFALSLSVTIFFGTEVRFPDEQDYIDIAHNLYLGKGFSGLAGNPTAARPPGLPLLVAFGYQLQIGTFFVKIINAFSIAMSGLILAGVISKVFPKAGWLPVMLVLSNPLILFTSTLLLPQTIGMCLLLIFILVLIQDQMNRPLWILAGVSYGILLSLIPAMILTLPILFFSTLFYSRLNLLQQFERCGWIVLTCSIVLSPWALRNSEQLGKFTPFSTQGGHNLILAFSENSTATSGADIDLSAFINNDFHDMDEVKQDSYLFKEAISWMKQNPSRVMHLYFGRIANYFSSSNQLSTDTQTSALRERVLFMSYYSLVIIALIRIPLAIRYPLGREERLLWIIYLGNAFVSAIFLTRIRYRSPFDALLILMVSYTLCYLYDFWRYRKDQQLPISENS